MIVISATEFKAKCLEILDRVKATGEQIQITKRGKVVAVLGPAQESTNLGAGAAKGFIKITGDIVEPLDIEWEASR